MFFNPNQSEFQNDMQRSVWQLGTHLVPPELSLAEIADEETREGCMQIYHCTMEILADMYQHPAAYAEPPRWYTGDYLAWLVTGRPPMKKHRAEFLRYLQKIPQFGFVYDADLNAWSNERYPLFCEYFARLVALAKERKQNLGGYLERRDFRLFAARIVLTLDDLLRPLSDREQALALKLHHYAAEKGMRVEKKSPYTFRYVYKKLYALEIHNLPFGMAVPYRLDNGKHVPGQLERFLALAARQPDADALLRYIQGGIRVCNCCNGTKKASERCGIWVEICGARRLSSACQPAIGKYRSGPRRLEYTEEDIRLLKRMMDIRMAQIDSPALTK